MVNILILSSSHNLWFFTGRPRGFQLENHHSPFNLFVSPGVGRDTSAGRMV